MHKCLKTQCLGWFLRPYTGCLFSGARHHGSQLYNHDIQGFRHVGVACPCQALCSHVVTTFFLDEELEERNSLTCDHTCSAGLRLPEVPFFSFSI